MLREDELSNPASSSECKGTSLTRGEGRIPKGSSGGTGHQEWDQRSETDSAYVSVQFLVGKNNRLPTDILRTAAVKTVSQGEIDSFQLLLEPKR